MFQKACLGSITMSELLKRVSGHGLTIPFSSARVNARVIAGNSAASRDQRQRRRGAPIATATARRRLVKRRSFQIRSATLENVVFQGAADVSKCSVENLCCGNSNEVDTICMAAWKANRLLS